MTGHFENLRFEAPFVVQERGRKGLHFTIGEVQSRMDVGRPDDLVIDYTRTMMGFLLLHPDPFNVAMIGLGGGSLPKFCHRHFPVSRITVIENNPGVIALRREFCIPDDDARFTVVADDGAAFVKASAPVIDVLVVDGFDHAGQPPQLCSQGFYDDCFRALRPGGVIVVNLHVDHPDHALFVARIDHSFRGNAMQVLAEEKSNCIVFAAKGRRVTLQALRSHDWSATLGERAQMQLRGEFARIGWEAVATAAMKGIVGDMPLASPP